MAGDFFGAGVGRLAAAGDFRETVVFFGVGREAFFGGLDAVREVARAGAAAFLAGGRAAR